MPELDLPAVIDVLERKIVPYLQDNHWSTSWFYNAVRDIRNLCPALISLLRQAQTDRAENERLKDQEAGKLRGIMNGLWKFAEEECGHKGHSSRHALSTVMEWVANAKAQLTAARERIAALERGLEPFAAYARNPRHTDLPDHAGISGVWMDANGDTHRGLLLEDCRTAAALLAVRAPAEGGGT